MPHKYTLIPDRAEHKALFSVVHVKASKLPDAVDLRSQCPVVYDQGELGSCTANALCAAFEFDVLKEKQADWQGSRLFLYYCERSMEHSISDDAGAALSDGIVALHLRGLCPETSWPYDIEKFAVKPPLQAFMAAVQHKTKTYARVTNNAATIKSLLASGFPVVVGITVFSGLESEDAARTGQVGMPSADEQPLGGHAVLIVGYTAHDTYIVRNSWGADWGDHGYFYLPTAYVAQYGQDLWTIKSV